MTVGKDVSALFPDVANCMQTDNLELKKLVYLYLMNYAKSQPDMAIMAVNTFVKDCEDPNPLIRFVFCTGRNVETYLFKVVFQSPCCENYGLHSGGQDH